jgi:hypothetical protein
MVIAGGDVSAVAALIAQGPALRNEIFTALQTQRGINLISNLYAACFLGQTQFVR